MCTTVGKAVLIVLLAAVAVNGESEETYGNTNHFMERIMERGRKLKTTCVISGTVENPLKAEITTASSKLEKCSSSTTAAPAGPAPAPAGPAQTPAPAGPAPATAGPAPAPATTTPPPTTTSTTNATTSTTVATTTMVTTTTTVATTTVTDNATVAVVDTTSTTVTTTTVTTTTVTTTTVTTTVPTTTTMVTTTAGTTTADATTTTKVTEGSGCAQPCGSHFTGMILSSVCGVLTPGESNSNCAVPPSNVLLSGCMSKTTLKLTCPENNGLAKRSPDIADGKFVECLPCGATPSKDLDPQPDKVWFSISFGHLKDYQSRSSKESLVDKYHVVPLDSKGRYIPPPASMLSVSRAPAARSYDAECCNEKLNEIKIVGDKPADLSSIMLVPVKGDMALPGGMVFDVTDVKGKVGQKKEVNSTIKIEFGDSQDMRTATRMGDYFDVALTQALAHYYETKIQSVLASASCGGSECSVSVRVLLDDLVMNTDADQFDRDSFKDDLKTRATKLGFTLADPVDITLTGVASAKIGEKEAPPSLAAPSAGFNSLTFLLATVMASAALFQ